MCCHLNVSTNGYYVWAKDIQSNRRRRDVQLRVKIRVAHKQNRGTYGIPRLTHVLRAAGERRTRKKVAAWMRAEGFCGHRKHRFKKTTDSDHDFKVPKNLLDRQFIKEAPNQAWVGDMTYIATPDGGFVYLAVLIDLFSRKVVGWLIGRLVDCQPYAHRIIFKCVEYGN